MPCVNRPPRARVDRIETVLNDNRRVSGPALKQITAAVTWLGLAVLAYAVYLVLLPFLPPLGWACVIAVFVHPAFERLVPRLGRSGSAAVTIVITAVILIVPSVLLTVSFAREMFDMATRLQDAMAGAEFSWVRRLWSDLTARVPTLAEVDLGAVATDGLRRAATFLMSESGAILTNIAAFFVDLVLALFAAFFILRDSDSIMRVVRSLLPMAQQQRESLIRNTGDLIAAGITSSAMVACVQGLLGGIAWAIVGLPSPLFWGVVMAFMCLLPFGAAVVYLPAAASLVASGSVGRGLLLAALGIGVVSLADNVVRPVLLSERVQINGLVVFIGLLGGLSAFGLLGIVLGPLVVATAQALLRSYVEAASEIVGPGPAPGDQTERRSGSNGPTSM